MKTISKKFNMGMMLIAIIMSVALAAPAMADWCYQQRYNESSSCGAEAYTYGSTEVNGDPYPSFNMPPDFKGTVYYPYKVPATATGAYLQVKWGYPNSTILENYSLQDCMVNPSGNIYLGIDNLGMAQGCGSVGMGIFCDIEADPFYSVIFSDSYTITQWQGFDGYGAITQDNVPTGNDTYFDGDFNTGGMFWWQDCSNNSLIPDFVSNEGGKVQLIYEVGIWWNMTEPPVNHNVTILSLSNYSTFTTDTLPYNVSLHYQGYSGDKCYHIFDSENFASKVCFQSLFNESTACGGIADPNTDVYDIGGYAGDFSTLPELSDLSNLYTLNFYYTIPEGATNESKLLLDYGYDLNHTLVNVTIPATCIDNALDNRLMLSYGFWQGGGGKYIYIICADSTFEYDVFFLHELGDTSTADRAVSTELSIRAPLDGDWDTGAWYDASTNTTYHNPTESGMPNAYELGVEWVMSNAVNCTDVTTILIVNTYGNHSVSVVAVDTNETLVGSDSVTFSVSAPETASPAGYTPIYTTRDLSKEAVDIGAIGALEILNTITLFVVVGIAIYAIHVVNVKIKGVKR